MNKTTAFYSRKYNGYAQYSITCWLVDTVCLFYFAAPIPMLPLLQPHQNHNFWRISYRESQKVDLHSRPATK